MDEFAVEKVVPTFVQQFNEADSERRAMLLKNYAFTVRYLSVKFPFFVLISPHEFFFLVLICLHGLAPPFSKV